MARARWACTSQPARASPTRDVWTASRCSPFSAAGKVRATYAPATSSNASSRASTGRATARVPAPEVRPRADCTRSRWRTCAATASRTPWEVTYRVWMIRVRAASTSARTAGLLLKDRAARPWTSCAARAKVSATCCNRGSVTPGPGQVPARRPRVRASVITTSCAITSGRPAPGSGAPAGAGGAGRTVHRSAAVCTTSPQVRSTTAASRSGASMSRSRAVWSASRRSSPTLRPSAPVMPAPVRSGPPGPPRTPPSRVGTPRPSATW